MKVLVCSYKMKDLVVWYFSEYIRKVFLPEISEKHDVVYLFEASYTRENVEKYLREWRPDVVIFACHGKETLLTGYNYQPVIKACENDHLLGGKKVDAISCLTAKELGVSAINKGALVYIGFLEPAYLVICADWSGDVTNCPLVDTYDPLQDPYAWPFLDTFFYPAYLLVQGKKYEDIYKLTMDRYDYWIDWALDKSAEDPCYRDVAECLMWNKKYFTIYSSGQEEERYYYAQSVAGALGVLSLIVIPLALIEERKK